MIRTAAFLLAYSAFSAYAQSYIPPRYSNVVYDTVDGVSLTMDIYEPPVTDGRARPVVITIHGGCFTGGAKEDMSSAAQSLASEGFVVANINYRKAPHYVYPAAQQDARAAVRYLRQNSQAYNIDTTRIASYGHSAGATLAATLGTQPIYDRSFQLDAYSQPVNLAVNMYGRMDFTHDAYPYTPEHWDCAEQYLGTSREQSPDAFRRASVLHNIAVNSARFINFHSVRDTVVLPVHAQRMHQRLREANIPSTLFIQEDGDHWAPDHIQRFVRKLMKREFGMAVELQESTGSSAIRIDSGNSQPSTVPAGYTIDQFYQGGKAITFDPVRYPIAQAVSKTVRWTTNRFAYRFSNTSTAVKKVRFSFIEPEDVQAGYRTQDILFAGFRLFDQHDIVKMAGRNRVTLLEDVYLATSTSTMNLEFVKKARGEAGVASLEVIPVQPLN